MSRIGTALQRLGIAASSSKLGGVFYHVVCRRIDSVLIPWSNGRLALGPPGRTVLMTTIGARSGRPRRAAVAFEWEGDDMIVVASKGGAPHHPGWYHNLVAHPRLRTRYRGIEEERVARVTRGPERDRLFARMAARFPNFAAYQERAGSRTIPVLLLSRPEEARTAEDRRSTRTAQREPF